MNWLLDLKSLKNLVNPAKNIRFGSKVSWLHKTTTAILIACSILVTARQFFGDPISCIHDDDSSGDVIESYCWISSTYTISSQRNGRLGFHFAQWGVRSKLDSDTIKYHLYYQWVYFILMLQAVFFYLPSAIWKQLEGGRIHQLSHGIKCVLNVVEDIQRERKTVIVNCVRSNPRRLNRYFHYFIACELMNFVNVATQMLLLDLFLNGDFGTFGADVISYYLAGEGQNEWTTDPFAKVFPKMTKCDFYQYGRSGTVEKFDTLCVLPLNVINEKIYLGIWFWFILLSIVSFIWLLYLLAAVFCAKLRTFMLKDSSVSPNNAQEVVKQSTIGMWFLLYQLRMNIDSNLFNEVLLELQCSVTNHANSNANETYQKFNSA